MVALINTVFSIAENSNKGDVEELMFGYVKCTAPSPFRSSL